MFAAALGRDVANGALQNLEQGLLHTFAGNVAGEGDVFGFARDFVDFVYVNDAALGALDVIVSILEQAQDDIFDVFADIAGLGEGGGVRDGKRNIQSAGERAGEQ